MQMPRLAIVLLAYCSACAGCSRDSAPPSPAGDGADVIAELAQHYQTAPTWIVTSRLELALVGPSGEELSEVETFVQTRQILVDSQHRFAVVADDGYAALCDGQHFVVTLAPERRYWRSDSPVSLTELRASPLAQYFGGAENLRSLELAGADPAAGILPPRQESAYFGREMVEGRDAHHLQIKPADAGQSSLTSIGTTDVWISAEGDPVLLKTIRRSPPRTLQLSPEQFVEAGTVETEVFTNWDFSPETDDASFRPDPEQRLRRVANLHALLNPPPPLLGETAPDVELVPIEGPAVPLSDLRGKVVLLDFWASWCGPCRMELPILARLEQEYADRGVVLYAVNLGETVNEIQGVLRRELADVKPALDRDHSIAGKYGVDGIPHLTIVGPDGRVQAVHIGVGDDTESVLREEIDALLAGVDLAEDGLPD